MTLIDRVTTWLSRLVQIPSVCPDQAGPRAGAPGEAAMAQIVADTFRSCDGEVTVEEVAPGRPNVYGIWRSPSNIWAAVDVHTDTVSVEQMCGDPFDGRVADGRVYGRGSVDTKATLAIVLTLLEVMWETHTQLPFNLLLVATVNEETGGMGAIAFANWIRRQGLTLDQLLVAEPTLCTPVHGHKGGMRMEFETKGVSAHSAQPHLGKNAITAMAHILLAVEAENQRLQAIPPDTPLGTATLTSVMIEGGLGSNLVPDRCRLMVGGRLVPGQEAEVIAPSLQAVVEAASPLPVETTFVWGMPPFFNSADSPWIQQLATWSGQIPTVAPYGTNAWHYGGLAKEMVVMGPGSIDQAHGDIEWVTLAELEKMTTIYERWWGLRGN